MIDPAHPKLSVKRQCQLLELSRLRRENRELHMRCEILNNRWESSATHPG